MAPKRGGGGGGGGGMSIRNIDDSYNPDLYWQEPERSAMYAQIVCAGLLLLAAIIALCMVGGKSWLNRNGKRNKTRLITFSVALVCLIIDEAVFIANTVLQLQGPNNINEFDSSSQWAFYHYYNTPDFVNRGLAVGFFDFVWPCLLYPLLLLEVTRHSAQLGRKWATFEIINLVIVSVVFVLGFTMWVRAVVNAVASTNVEPDVSIGLVVTWAALSVLFAIILLFRKRIDSSSFARATRTASKTWDLLYWSIFAMWLSQLCSLAAICDVIFGHHVMRTPSFALSATSNALWILPVLGLAVLAWKSHKSHQTGHTYDQAGADVQPETAKPNTSRFNTAPTGNYHFGYYQSSDYHAGYQQLNSNYQPVDYQPDRHLASYEQPGHDLPMSYVSPPAAYQIGTAHTSNFHSPYYGNQSVHKEPVITTTQARH